MQNTQFEFQRERKFGEVINAAFTFLVGNFLPLIKFMIIYSFPFLIVGFLLIGTVNFPLLMDRSGPENIYYGSENVFNLKTIVGILLTLIGLLVLTTSVFGYIRAYHENGKGNISNQDVWDILIRKFWPMLGLSIMLVIMYFISGVIVGLFSALVRIPVLILFLYIFYYASFSSIFYYAAAAVVLGDISAPESINRSLEMVRGRFWFTFGLIFTLIVFLFIVSSLSSLPSIIIAYLNNVTEISEQVNHLFNFISLAIYIFAIFLFLIISNNVKAVQYYNVIEQHGKTRLIKKIESIIEEDEEKPE